MLGRMLCDPERLESNIGTISGMGLLDIEVQFDRKKTVTQRIYRPTPQNPFAAAGSITGYEIHGGVVRRGDCAPLYEFEGGVDGAIDPELRVCGTFIHDLFNNPQFSRLFINSLRERKGLPALCGPLPDRRGRSDEACDLLASSLEENTAF